MSFFKQHYNKTDATAITALFTEDGVLVTPAGILSGERGSKRLTRYIQEPPRDRPGDSDR
jgi:hypothetical protein